MYFALDFNQTTFSYYFSRTINYFSPTINTNTLLELKSDITHLDCFHSWWKKLQSFVLNISTLTLRKHYYVDQDIIHTSRNYMLTVLLASTARYFLQDIQWWLWNSLLFCYSKNRAVKKVPQKPLEATHEKMQQGNLNFPSQPAKCEKHRSDLPGGITGFSEVLHDFRER